MADVYIYQLIIMKIIILFLISTLFITCVNVKKGEKSSNFRIINILETTIVGDTSNRLENDSSGFNIIYSGDYEIFEYPIILLKSDTPKIIDGIYTIESRVSRDTLFNYFVSKIGSKKVLSYNKVDVKIPTIITRDSLLLLFDVNPANLKYLNFDLGPVFKTIKSGNKNSKEIEYFVDNNPKNESFADTVIRYYDKDFKGISFSYAPDLDKIKKSKLVLTRFITLPRKVIRKNGAIEITPYLEDSSIIREVKTTRNKIYMALIERFKKDYEKLASK